jgi:hypothetical protein
LAHFLARAKFVAQPFMIFHASRSVGIICECGAIIHGKCTPVETQLSMLDPTESIAHIFSILNIFTVWIEFDAVSVSAQLLNVAQLLRFHEKDKKHIEKKHEGD